MRGRLGRHLIQVPSARVLLIDDLTEGAGDRRAWRSRRIVAANS